MTALDFPTEAARRLVATALDEDLGPDGLDVVRVISREARRLLHPGGFIAIEHGEWQGAPIRDLLTRDGWRASATHPDLTMRDRATTASRS